MCSTHGFFLLLITGVAASRLRTAVVSSAQVSQASRLSLLNTTALQVPAAFVNVTTTKAADMAATNNKSGVVGLAAESSPAKIPDIPKSGAVRANVSSRASATKGVEYTLRSPTNDYLYLIQKHSSDGYKFFQLMTYVVEVKNWRPTPSQNHFLWNVDGPDADGDVRIVNAKFGVALTVKRKSGLLTTRTWAGACSESQPQCPDEFLLYKPKDPYPEERGTVFVFHQSQYFLEHTDPHVSSRPYRSTLWFFNPPVPNNMIYGTLAPKESGWR